MKRSAPVRFLMAMMAGAGLAGAAPAWGTAVGALGQVAAEAEAKSPPRFIRVVESKSGQNVRLELVIRSFAPAEGEGPTVDLVAAAHIADRAFYERLQAHLDAKDLVLYEGVKPAAVGGRGDEAEDGALTDEERAERTRRRIRLVAALIERHKAAVGEYPASLDELAAGEDKRIAWLAQSAAVDAWGAPLVYTVDVEGDGARGGFNVVSYGADGEPGGEGAAADIAFTDGPPLSEAERVSDDPGIQQRFASALGLVFQLDVMDHTGANWRNSDMTVEELQERLEEAGVEAGVLFKTLDGTSFSAKLMGLVLKLIGSNPACSAMGKVVLVDMLARADEILEAAPGEMGAMMGVIIHERNRVLLDDLRAVMENEPEVKTIGIIYGAGHLADIEKRLVEEFGYVVVGEEWVPAIEVDLDAAGVPPVQAQRLRGMLKQVFDQQIKTMERRRPRR